jgi:predicted ATPase
MITELTARNFKSWKDTGTLQFAPLTGLFGANSSGKTSILQILLMLKQTVEQPSDWNEPLYFGDEGSLVNLGNFNDIIHKHKLDLSLDISVSWKSSTVADINKYIRFYNLNVETLLPSQGDRDRSGEISFSTNIFRGAVNNFHYKTDLYRFDGQQPDLFRCYGLRIARNQIMEISSRFEKDFENLFSRILYLGPLREHPQYHYIWKGDHPEGIGQEGEKAIPALLSRRVRHLSIDKQILNWLQRLDLIDSYDLRPISDTNQDYEFLVKQYKSGPEVRLTDVGFGVSQVLPVLILCYYAPEGSILILEQPEAHLHPKAQTELADVLIDAVTNRNIQIILESHSEYLLSRLQRRIAEKEIASVDTALYFCEINDGTSQIERLDVDEYGNIRNWPQDFFGDVTGELIKKTKVEMQQRKVMS